MNISPFGSNIDSDDAVMPMTKATAPLVDAPPATAAPAPCTGPRVRIVLEDNDQVPPTGQFFGADGRGFILRSGEEADVPPEIIHILNCAVFEAPVVDPTTQQIIGYRKRLRFPYRVIRAAA